MGKFSFSKEERLRGRKIIQELFDKGSSFYLHPFKIIYRKHPLQDEARSQILITVPSRNFGKSIDRNKIKRRVREGYRLNKEKLRPERKWLIAYIYVAKDILPSSLIHLKISESLVTLNDRHEK
jgi:ribonuclease P protein component